MNFKQIQELIKLVDGSNIGEVKLEEENFKLTIKSNCFGQKISIPQQPTMIAAPMPAPTAMPTAAPIAAAAVSADKEDTQESDENSKYIEFKSPMIGTFYRSPGPEKPVFIKVGDTINVGDVVCIVEAMKLFNEIESEIAGKIVKVLVDDASPVEYEQPLFLIDPS